MHFSHWLFRLPVFRQFVAVTLPWGIYFRDPADQVDAGIIAHELVHVRQREAIGVVRFYLDYACQFASNYLRSWDFDDAYRKITFEQEAYAHEHALR